MSRLASNDTARQTSVAPKKLMTVVSYRDLSKCIILKKKPYRFQQIAATKLILLRATILKEEKVKRKPHLSSMFLLAYVK